jgi:vitamin B12 transporter
MSRHLIILILAVFPSFVRAQAPARPSPLTDEIVVTASALEEPVASVPAAVTVITREQIEARAARDVAEVLREVPGIYVSRTGSPGKAVSLFTRGGSSTQTLVMWNGVKMNNPYFAGYEIGTFSSAGVEKIEVVRGPFSALYGSDAMAGVVNILGATDWTGVEASLEAGENGLVNGLASGAWKSGSLRVDGTVEHRQDDGFSANDDYDQNTLAGSAMWSRGGFEAGLRLRYSAWEIGIPFNTSADGLALVPSPSRRQDGEELQFHVPLGQQLGAFSWDMTLSRYDRDDRFEDPDDPFGFVASDTESTTDRARLVTRVRTTRFGTLVAGAEVERAEVDDVSSYGVNLMDATRKATSFFVEERYGAEVGSYLLELAAGIRYDDFDTFGSELSPRVAGALIRGAHKLRFAYGEGFRAPSIGELYFPFFGNSELDPERSRSMELGYDLLLQGSTLSLTLFDNDFDNLIVYDNAAFRFENTGAARTRGIELGLSTVIGRGVSGGLSYTWLDTEQASTGEALLRRPEHSGSVHLAFTRNAFDSILVVTHGGSRNDVRPVFPYDTVVNEAWTTADVTLRYRLGSIQPYVSVENLFDEEHEEVLGYPSPGRRALIGARYSLK